MPQKPKAYLAGPAVFHPDAKAQLERLAKLCAAQGLDGVVPFEPSAEDMTLAPAELAALIRRRNMERIRAADVVIACISPFRGAGACPGTTWEMGYAEGLGKPVVGWCENTEPYIARVPHDRHEDGRAFCRQHGMMVEDFGLVDNLMYAAAPVAIQSDVKAAIRLALQLSAPSAG